uniref:Uncharacterized protein n=1 Tax=Aegilops tauschii subsp. strangulata TaxID=200361 RepID=A0A453GFI2_AEGTS
MSLLSSADKGYVEKKRRPRVQSSSKSVGSDHLVVPETPSACLGSEISHFARPWGTPLMFLIYHGPNLRCRCVCEERRRSTGRRSFFVRKGAACYSSPSPSLLEEQERHGHHHTGEMDEDMKLSWRGRGGRRCTPTPRTPRFPSSLPLITTSAAP